MADRHKLGNNVQRWEDRQNSGDGYRKSEFKGDGFSLSYTGNEKTWRRTVNRC